MRYQSPAISWMLTILSFSTVYAAEAPVDAAVRACTFAVVYAKAMASEPEDAAPEEEPCVLLAALYEKPQNIKELSKNTRLNYSSISGILHDLELKEFVYRESNRYYLVNSIHTQMANVLELKEVVNLLNNFFNIIITNLDYGNNALNVVPKFCSCILKLSDTISSQDLILNLQNIISQYNIR